MHGYYFKVKKKKHFKSAFGTDRYTSLSYNICTVGLNKTKPDYPVHESNRWKPPLQCSESHGAQSIVD